MAVICDFTHFLLFFDTRRQSVSICHDVDEVLGYFWAFWASDTGALDMIPALGGAR